MIDALMREALAEAAAAGEAGEYPIGAVVAVRGEIVARGRARHRARCSQLAHAELDALSIAGDPLWSDDDEAVLVSTLEPCPMCLGAAVMADVGHVVFGLHDGLAGVRAMLEIPYVARHIRSYRGGVLEDESRALWTRYEPALLERIAIRP